MLELAKLSKTFQGPEGLVRAVDQVSCGIDPGQFVTMQGPSGSGKTTLLLMLGGLLRPDQGTLTLDGVDPYQLDANERATWRVKQVGFVFQQFHLVPYLSVLENVMIPSVSQPRSDAALRARDILSTVGLQDRLRHLPSQLSVGEQQRTALARALFNDPALILADEPTGNLDDKNAEIVLQCLKKSADQGKTVLIVTHDQRTAAFATSRLHLQHGQLQEVSETKTPVTQEGAAVA